MLGGYSRELCGAVAVALLLLLLVGHSTAYPSRYPLPESLSPHVPVKRANARGQIRVQPKADRFYLGPRFGKRAEVPDYAVLGGEPEQAAEEPAGVPLEPEQLTLRCSLAGPTRSYRCRLDLGLESASRQ